MELDADSDLSHDALTGSAFPEGHQPNPAWESYYADLRSFVARQLGGRQDADDVVQDIYRQVLHSSHAEIQNPRAWIWRIAWRVVHDAFQRDKRRRSQHITADPKVIEALASRDDFNTVPALDAHLEAQDELLAALSELPVAAQIAIVRSRRDGWSYEQIAVELNVTPHMVKKHMVRALAHLDAYLERTEAPNSSQGGGL
jgi:RNA polymerase sigma factor (sigma-70 family)